MKGFLDESERIRLLEQHKKERDKRVCDRIKAVLLYDKGWTYERIAEALFISHEAIRQHVLDYEANRKLSSQNGGSSSKLNVFQKRMLIEHLRDRTYMKAKDIAAFVLEEFGIAYTASGITQWLKENGFSYKKPAVVPGKANQEAQEKWIQEYNEMKGNLPEDETLDAESTIRFLQKIEVTYPEKEKIHIFCDNARYYRNKKVQAFLEESKISMHFLPPYSPNLNPIERLWKLMNEEVINNKYYEKFSEFKENILCFLKSLAAPPNRILKALKSRVRDSFRAIGFACFSRSFN